VSDDGCYWCDSDEVILGGVVAAGPHAVCPTCARQVCRRCGELLTFCVCETIRCEKCGIRFGIGQSPVCKDGHDYVGRYEPFTAYFDIGLGVEVTSHAQRWRLMREAKVDYRDKLSKGELSARRDRVEQQRREQARG
jgi:hypothetical protein